MTLLTGVLSFLNKIKNKEKNATIVNIKIKLPHEKKIHQYSPFFRSLKISHKEFIWFKGAVSYNSIRTNSGITL